MVTFNLIQCFFYRIILHLDITLFIKIHKLYQNILSKIEIDPLFKVFNKKNYSLYAVFEDLNKLLRKDLITN